MLLFQHAGHWIGVTTVCRHFWALLHQEMCMSSDSKIMLPVSYLFQISSCNWVTCWFGLLESSLAPLFGVSDAHVEPVPLVQRPSDASGFTGWRRKAWNRRRLLPTLANPLAVGQFWPIQTAVEKLPLADLKRSWVSHLAGSNSRGGLIFKPPHPSKKKHMGTLWFITRHDKTYGGHMEPSSTRPGAPKRLTSGAPQSSSPQNRSPSVSTSRDGI